MVYFVFINHAADFSLVIFTKKEGAPVVGQAAVVDIERFIIIGQDIALFPHRIEFGV